MIYFLLLHLLFVIPSTLTVRMLERSFVGGKAHADSSRRDSVGLKFVLRNLNMLNQGQLGGSNKKTNLFEFPELFSLHCI